LSSVDRYLYPDGEFPIPVLGQTPFDINGPSQNTEKRRMDANRRLLQEVYQRQGFNGKPEVVSPEEYANLIARGEVLANNGRPLILVRAVSRDSNLDDLFYGEEHHVPRQPGWYGTGTYFGVPRGYSPWDNLVTPVTNEIFLETTIPFKINTLTRNYGTRGYEYQLSTGQTEAEWNAEAFSRKPAVMMATLKSDAKTNFAFVNSVAEYDLWVKNLTSEFAKRYGRLSPDLGTMAAMLGYDAIQIPTFVNRSGNEMLVFNRSKLIVTELNRATAPVVDTVNDNFQAWNIFSKDTENQYRNRILPRISRIKDNVIVGAWEA